MSRRRESTGIGALATPYKSPSVCGCLNQRGEDRVGTQTIREFPNELLHGGVPEAVETEEIHFVHRLFGGPLVHAHTVGGNENAGAVVPEAAVHKNLLVRLVVKQGEELRHLF